MGEIEAPLRVAWGHYARARQCLAEAARAYWSSGVFDEAVRARFRDAVRDVVEAERRLGAAEDAQGFPPRPPVPDREGGTVA